MISEIMLNTITENERIATKRADEFALQAADYRKAAERAEQSAMMARQDAEAWQTIRDQYAPNSDDDGGVQAGGGWCACGLPGVPGMAHAISDCVQTTDDEDDMDRLVAGRRPYGLASTAVMPVIEPADAGNGAL